MILTACETCGLPAEEVDKQQFESTDEPVTITRYRCVDKHIYDTFSGG